MQSKMQKIENYGVAFIGGVMKFGWLYKALLTIIITCVVMFLIDILGIENPISETINEIEGIFYVTCGVEC